MERAARWTKEHLSAAPDGVITVPIAAGDTELSLELTPGDASLIQAQLDRILDGGQVDRQFDGPGLHPNYRGPVN